MPGARSALAAIPHPPRTVLLGNILALGAKTPVQDLMKLAKQYGPIYWLDMLGKPLIVVSGFSLVDELCDETRFDKSVRGPLRRLRSFVGDGLFTAYTQEPNWAKAHNVLLPAFSQRAMQSYHPLMLDIAEQLMLRWERLNPDDEIDVTRDMTSLTLDTIGLCGFDYRFNSFYRERNHPLVDAMVTALGLSMETRGLPLENVLHKDRERKLRASSRLMSEQVDRIIQERRASGEDLATKRDLLSYMLLGVDKSTGERLDDVNIRYQVLTFLIAGHETTSGLLSFALYFLLNNPEALATASQEVDRVLGPDPTVKPTYAQIGQLGYVAQVLKESLRLWPTAPTFAVYPYQDTAIGGRYELKKNQHVVVLVPMLHRDPSVWGDGAERFDPDHFSRQAEQTRPPNAYKPFGNGQRACIGRQFAMQEATLVLGMILQRFRLIDHTRYRMQLKETLTVKPDDFRIKVRLRSDRERPVVAPQPVATAAPAPAATRTAPGPRHGTPLLVLYGSNLGTSEELARQIAQDAEANGFAATLGPLDRFVSQLPRAGAVVIASASYNGAPPDNAVKFCDWLRGGLPADALAGVSYTVFGCGNRDWAATFQQIPRLIDAKLEAYGARRLHPRGEGDARDDFDGQFRAWYDPMWGAVADALAIDLTPPERAAAERLLSVEVVPGARMSPFVHSLSAQPMRVAVNRELHTKTGPRPSERSTRHLELELPEGTTYRAGDHLGVIAHNSEALVRRAAARFGFDREAAVRLRTTGLRQTFLPVDDVISVDRLLADYVELQDVATRKQIQTLVQHTECPWTRPQLQALAGDDESSAARYKAEVLAARRSVLDLLEQFPACQLPFAAFLEMLSPLAPRYYSISSSPLLHPRRCSITVAVVDAPARSGRGRFRGVCSNYLGELAEGSVVHAFVKDTKSTFRLPSDPRLPIIMVGPGTGVAPFRGFLQERAALRAQGALVGPSLLFYGCRDPEQDFLYADELRDLVEHGVTNLEVAFSRVDAPTKCYVQNRILERADDVWKLIEAGAAVYVCGDASRMAPDVRRAFATLYRRRMGSDEPAAERWLDELTARGRYLVDVWAAT
jgi:cytochrome P450/NADPH-cytochrome P450 reductase